MNGIYYDLDDLGGGHVHGEYDPLDCDTSRRESQDGWAQAGFGCRVRVDSVEVIRRN